MVPAREGRQCSSREAQDLGRALLSRNHNNRGPTNTDGRMRNRNHRAKVRVCGLRPRLRPARAQTGAAIQTAENAVLTAMPQLEPTSPPRVWVTCLWAFCPLLHCEGPEAGHRALMHESLSPSAQHLAGREPPALN